MSQGRFFDMMKKLKQLISLVATVALVASCTQQQQEVEDPLKPIPTEPVIVKPTTPAKPKPAKPVKPEKPAKPFVPAAPGVRVSSVSVPGKYVAITFDDGPHATLTPQVLDVLKKYGAKATFFVAGSNAARYPSIMARAAAEGHEIGNHTYSHIQMTAATQEKIDSEISRTNALIEAATGSKPKVMRPPYGAINAKLVSRMFNTYGLKSILWNVDTNDWRRPGSSVVVQRALDGAKPGAIILMHDIHAGTAAAVEGIVTGLQARGYTLVTVSELIEMGRVAAKAAEPKPAPVVAPAAPATEVTAPVTEVAAPEEAPIADPLAPLPVEVPAAQGSATLGGVAI